MLTEPAAGRVTSKVMLCVAIADTLPTSSRNAAYRICVPVEGNRKSGQVAGGNTVQVAVLKSRLCCNAHSVAPFALPTAEALLPMREVTWLRFTYGELMPLTGSSASCAPCGGVVSRVITCAGIDATLRA